MRIEYSDEIRCIQSMSIVNDNKRIGGKTMKQMRKKCCLILIMVLIIGVFDNVIVASAAVKSTWSFKTGSGIKLEVNETIYLKKNQFQDFNLYKSGKEIKQNDSTYVITWSSSDEDVIWINAKNGKSRADKFGTMEEDTGKAVITAKIKNKKTKAVTCRSFNVVVGQEKQEPTKAPTVTPVPTKAPTATPTPTPTVKPIDDKLNCNWSMSQSVISAGGWFSRAIGLTADVSGGTGEYKYYFALYKNDSSIQILSSSDSTNPVFSFRVSENFDMRVEVTIVDSNGKSGYFTYEIPRYE